MLNIRTIHVIQNPAGTYSLVGRVPANLAYQNADGSPPTERQIDAAKHCGPGFAVPRLRVKTGPTEQEARDAVIAAGYKVA